MKVSSAWLNLKFSILFVEKNRNTHKNLNLGDY